MSPTDEDVAVIGDEQTQSKGERKARKALAKHGLKAVPGITRVTVKKRNSLLVVATPEVFKCGPDTYVVFGDITAEDSNQIAQQANEAWNANKAGENVTAEDVLDAVDTDETPELVEGAVDETGLEETDIELVMSQANATRAKAVKALSNNNGDIVNAIMELTL